MQTLKYSEEQTSPYLCEGCGHWMEYLSDGIYMCQTEGCEAGYIDEEDE